MFGQHKGTHVRAAGVPSAAHTPSAARPPAAAHKGPSPRRRGADAPPADAPKHVTSASSERAWDDIAGLESAKEALRGAVILPLLQPSLFVGGRVPWKGILLFGPPGTGKSFLAQAVAAAVGARFIAVSSTDIVDKYVGESEKAIAALFEKARVSQPCVIFIDEVDGLTQARGGVNELESSRRMKNELLQQMDGGGGHDNSGVLVLGATNVPWEIDIAFRRRFEKRIFIPLPDAPTRAAIFKLKVGTTPNTLTDADYAAFGNRTEGFSGSDIKTVVKSALNQPLQRFLNARFWRPRREGRSTEGKIQWEPVEDPHCPSCSLDSSSGGSKPRLIPCARCGNVRARIFDFGDGDVAVPPTTAAHFEDALARARPASAASDLARFKEWTKAFGEDGSGESSGDGERAFDNFKFCEHAAAMRTAAQHAPAAEPARRQYIESQFAVAALLEVPEQYREMVRLGLMGRVAVAPFKVRTLEPPAAVPGPPPPAPTAGGAGGGAAPALEAALCVICLDAPANTALLPCGHLHFCHKHAQRIANTTKVCPIGREPVTGVLRTFA